MKKIIITAIIIIGAIGSYWYYAQAAIVTVDSYSESNYSTDETLSSIFHQSAGQSYTATGVTLDSVKFYLRKSSSPTGNATAILYAHSGTYGTNSLPTGSALATSDNFDVSTLTTSYQLITFNFTGANRYSLVDGTKYVIQLSYSGGDAVNIIQLGLDEFAPVSHSGNRSFLFGSWFSSSAGDDIFYVYGDDAAPASVPSTISDFVLFE